jgi:transcriptional regulator with XRE-family HTH domain
MSDKEFLKNLGKRLQSIRKQRNISLRDIQSLNINDISNMSRTENGLVNPKIITLKKLADLYEVDIREFL